MAQIRGKNKGDKQWHPIHVEKDKDGKYCLQVILVAYNPGDGKYYPVQCDNLGRLVIAP